MCIRGSNNELMISDIEYLLNEIKNLINENNDLHKEIIRRIENYLNERRWRKCLK